MRKSTIGQGMVFLIVMIIGVPIVAKLGNSYGLFFIQMMMLVTIGVVSLSLVTFIKNYENRERGNQHLFSFYIDIFIFYSLAYTFAVVASPSGGFLSGLHDICNKCSSYQEAELTDVLLELMPLFIDAMYYSVVNMTTLGDSSISPQNIMKLVVVSQVGFTFFITVYGIAEYFSSETSKELKQLVKEIGSKQGSESSMSNGQIVVPVKERIFVSIKGLFTGRYV